jgi:uncharacterized glyoxalase superfamily protein PhnB
MSDTTISSRTNDTSASFEAVSLAASLTVADLRGSTAWYRDVLGFAVAREYERDGALIAVTMSAGEIELLLTQDNGARGEERVKGEGFSLRFTTAQDVDALASGIVARGGVLDMEPTDAFGARVFRLRDPDGFRLVISSQK